MEEPTLGARDVLMSILPQFLHFEKSYCKSSLNLGKTYQKFTKSSLSDVKKFGKLNKGFGGFFTLIPPIRYHEMNELG